VEPGEILGFLGPNGAGKTTTVGMLYGAVIPTRGVVRFNGYTLPGEGREARRGMGIVTQEDNLDPDFHVVDNLVCFANHYGMWGRVARDRAEELVERVGLQEHRNHVPDDLSGGLKRRLVLARALLNKPRLIFLDEPTTGLDPESRQGFWKLVADLRQEGCGVVLTTHYMDEAQRLCDRLILMQEGLMVDRGTPAELIQRTVGKEVVEVEGVAEETLRDLAERQGSWWRRFGTGHLIAIRAEDRHICLDALEQMNPRRLTLREANLEDVFLRLTGDLLD
jgi:lipooligosaccharide transport system ATP-binding protein